MHDVYVFLAGMVFMDAIWGFFILVRRHIDRKYYGEG